MFGKEFQLQPDWPWEREALPGHQLPAFRGSVLHCICSADGFPPLLPKALLCLSCWRRNQSWKFIADIFAIIFSLVCISLFQCFVFPLDFIIFSPVSLLHVLQVGCRVWGTFTEKLIIWSLKSKDLFACWGRGPPCSATRDREVDFFEPGNLFTWILNPIVM